jgi:hypothetical protein
VRSFDEAAVALLAEHRWEKEPHWGSMRYRSGQAVAEPARTEDGSTIYVAGWTSHDGDGVYVASFMLKMPRC